MSLEIGIIDYGLSNIACVKAAVEHIGCHAISGNRAEIIEKADKVILPGVGAFPDAMNNLNQLGLVDVLNAHIRDGDKPFLGICLGAQLLAKSSDEVADCKGLGWINAHVKKLDSGSKNLRVPHTGWDDVNQLKQCVLFNDLSNEPVFYYTHSHGIFCGDESVVVATCDYGENIVSVIHSDNIYATQFHPEKSQQDGLKLLENFLMSA